MRFCAYEQINVSGNRSASRDPLWFKLGETVPALALGWLGAPKRGVFLLPFPPLSPRSFLLTFTCARPGEMIMVDSPYDNVAGIVSMVYVG